MILNIKFNDATMSYLLSMFCIISIDHLLTLHV